MHNSFPGTGVTYGTSSLPCTVIPAKAGIHVANHSKCVPGVLDSRLRGNDLVENGASFQITPASISASIRAASRILGNIEFSQSEPAGKLADGSPAGVLTIHPDLRKLIHRAKTEQIPAVRVWNFNRRKLAPVPDDTVVLGKGLLNDAVHRHLLRLWHWTLEPFLSAPRILWICGNQPVPIQ
jgi:hypothetical protein